MRTAEEIVGIWRWRVEECGPVHRLAMKVRDLANGDVIIPLNELDRTAIPGVANLLVQGLDQTSMRIASTMPRPFFPPLRPGVDREKAKARTRTTAVLRWWDVNRMGLKLRRRARYYVGYGKTGVVIRPDFEYEYPCWKIRDPLLTFPARSDDPDDPVPSDCIFVYRQPLGWLRRHYRDQLVGFGDEGSGMPLRGIAKGNDQTPFRVLEYLDAEQMTLIALAPEKDLRDIDPLATTGCDHVLLERLPNRAETPLAVVPERITLDRVRGQVAGMLGLYYNRARMEALTSIAVQRGIFPTEWVVADGASQPEIINLPDPENGKPGMIRYGKIETQQLNPGYRSNEAIDRAERQERQEGGIPAEYGGESASNVRTGRRGDSILSATIDYRIQEAQAVFQESLLAEDRIAIAVDRAYWGSTSISFYTPNRKGARSDYVPDKLWESDVHHVSYSMVGADANTLAVGLGQRLGIGIMSKETARESDPFIEDPELEHDRIQVEQAEDAIMAMIQQKVAAGEISPTDLALFTRLILVQGMPLYEALEQVQEAAQERQAAEAAQELPPEQMQPGMGPGEVVPDPSVMQPSAGVSNVANLVSRLNRPRQVAGSLERSA